MPPEALSDRRMLDRLRGSERVAGLAPMAARWGLLRMADPLAGDPIGLPPEAAAAKHDAFLSERHNRAGAAEAHAWLADAEAAREAGELSRELPVAVVTVGGSEGVRDLLQAPARRSRRGYVEHVEAANGATILGERHAEAVVRAVEHVIRFAPPRLIARLCRAAVGERNLKTVVTDCWHVGVGQLPGTRAGERLHLPQLHRRRLRQEAHRPPRTRSPVPTT